MKLSKYAMSTNEKFKMPHKTYQTHEEKSYNIEVKKLVLNPLKQEQMTTLKYKYCANCLIH